jgi:hypothetical protein
MYNEYRTVGHNDRNQSGLVLSNWYMVITIAHWKQEQVGESTGASDSDFYQQQLYF